MRLPLPKALNPSQSDDDTRGLVLVDPTVSASVNDENATVLNMNGSEHRVPQDWAIAETRLGETAVAFLRKGDAVKVLTADRSGRIREAKGYGSSILAEIRTSRFGEARKASPEATEVERLIALSDSAARPLSEAGDAETDRLVELSNSLDGSASDDAEADRLAKLAEKL